MRWKLWSVWTKLVFAHTRVECSGFVNYWSTTGFIGALGFPCDTENPQFFMNNRQCQYSLYLSRLSRFDGGLTLKFAHTCNLLMGSDRCWNVLSFILPLTLLVWTLIFIIIEAKKVTLACSLQISRMNSIFGGCKCRGSHRTVSISHETVKQKNWHVEVCSELPQPEQASLYFHISLRTKTFVTEFRSWPFLRLTSFV